jgi:hypothetical protein
MANLLSNKHRILIQCADGRNKSMLIAGYYLITRGKMNPDQVVNMLETKYFSDQQRADDIRDDEITRKAILGEDPPKFSDDDRQRQSERRDLRCLTRRSFQKLLRTIKP